MLWKIRPLLLATFFTIVAPATAQASLDQLVPADRQKQLGLDKLSAQQRIEVVKLLQAAYQIGEQEGKRKAMTSKPPASSVIESQIDGDFEGWEVTVR